MFFALMLVGLRKRDPTMAATIVGEVLWDLSWTRVKNAVATLYYLGERGIKPHTTTWSVVLSI